MEPVEMKMKGAASKTATTAAAATKPRTGAATHAVEQQLEEVAVAGTSTTLRKYETFESMPLRATLLRGIFASGLERPSPVQQVGIVAMIRGGDVIVQAQSGMGKTATFSIGVLQRVDMAQTSPAGVVTEVRRVDLNCERGEETLLGVRGFDAEGRELMARANKQPKPVPIANFHSATLRLVCSGDYLLPLVPGLAEARAHEAQAAKAERLSKVGDRAIPVTR